nr:response regulator [Roseburia sp. AM59-24XD]
MEQILIVEDDRGLNAGLCRALKEPGRRTISCQSLQAAREQLITGSVSLVLLDISLPDGNGLTLLREIKEQTPQMPVILLTANDTDMDIVEGLEQGADDYITKPFSLPCYGRVSERSCAVIPRQTHPLCLFKETTRLILQGFASH